MSRIIHVEDQQEWIDITRRALADHDIDPAATYDDALAIIRANPPYDLALIDLNLDGDSDLLGGAILELLKSDYPSTRRVVVTAFPPEGGMRRDILERYEAEEIIIKGEHYISHLRRFVSPAAGGPGGDSPVFIVHGTDTERAEIVARTVENATGRRAIMLRDMPNRGRTAIEKFEHNAGAASYAVVVVTADDEGGHRGRDQRQLRGRQNVVFEMGYFFGRLGRDRVSVLLDPDVEKPSDMEGIVYILLDGQGVWKSALLREMHAAGLSTDRSRC